MVAEYAKDVEYFNNTKCYRCKNFKNSLHIVYSTPLEPLCMGDFESVEDFRQQYPNAQVKSYSHNMICLEREKSHPMGAGFCGCLFNWLSPGC